MSKPVSVNKTSPTKLRINLRKIKLNNTINKLKEVAQAFTLLTNTSDDKSIYYKKIINLLHKVKENNFNLLVDSQVYDLFMNEDEKNVSKNVDSLLDEERELCFKKKEVFDQFIEQLESEENCVNLVQD